MCKHNKFVAQQFGFLDIAQCWSLAELIASSSNDIESDDDMFFNQIPFPKNILESLYVYIQKLSICFHQNKRKRSHFPLGYCTFHRITIFRRRQCCAVPLDVTAHHMSFREHPVLAANLSITA